jgi:hypothetical protein
VKNKKKQPYISCFLDELGNYHLGAHILKARDYYEPPLGKALHFIQSTGLLES